jgi:hypothetical protein
MPKQRKWVKSEKERERERELDVHMVTDETSEQHTYAQTIDDSEKVKKKIIISSQCQCHVP